MDSILSDLFSSLFLPEQLCNEAPAPEPEDVPTETEDAPIEQSAKDDAEEPEEEEEEPEDPAPPLRDECAATAACTPLKQHFDHCTEKINSGKGFKHEDCVEELFHLMHCVDNCIAPKLFSKLA